MLGAVCDVRSLRCCYCCTLYRSSVCYKFVVISARVDCWFETCLARLTNTHL